MPDYMDPERQHGIAREALENPYGLAARPGREFDAPEGPSHRMTTEQLHWATQIQHDARLEAIDHPAPLVPGERIAWVECDYGNTDHFSFRHRIRDELSTQCGQPIPAAVRRCPDDLARVLKPCLACVEAMRKAA